MKRMTLWVCLILVLSASGAVAEGGDLVMTEYDHDQVLHYLSQQYDLAAFRGAVFADSQGNITVVPRKPAGFDDSFSSGSLPFWYGYVNTDTREGLLVLVSENDGMVLVHTIHLDRVSASSVAEALGRKQAPRESSLGRAQSTTAERIRYPLEEPWGVRFWRTVEDRLESQGVSSLQVQVIWLKEANIGPSQMFPYESKRLEEDLEAIMHILVERFPNLKLAYLSSRIYAGYAETPLNPEPFAYESGFAVKWLIERQIQGDPELNWDPTSGEVKAPWLSWGPYLWADGLDPRETDGLMWERDDFGNDGTHPSEKGREKVAELLLRFFQTDETSREWFMRRGHTEGGSS